MKLATSGSSPAKPRPPWAKGCGPSRSVTNLYEVVVMRPNVAFGEPPASATDAEGVATIIKEAMVKPFTRIEVCDVSHIATRSSWNQLLRDLKAFGESFRRGRKRHNDQGELPRRQRGWSARKGYE